jgi:hypothetical protein
MMRTPNHRATGPTATTARSTVPAGQATGADSTPSLSEDLLRGADAIAEFLFGDRSQRRKVYYLVGEAKVCLPHFKLGAMICARRSKLLRWIEEREDRGSRDA